MSPSSFSSSDSSSFNSRFAPPSPGAGSSLPTWLLALCGAFTAVGTHFTFVSNDLAEHCTATAVSVMSITLQLKNYRKPSLQRAVVRIMVMSAALYSLYHNELTRGRVPLYAISSLIALFSLEAAFFIDAVRDLYEVAGHRAVLPRTTKLIQVGVRNLHLLPTPHHLPRRRKIPSNHLTRTTAHPPSLPSQPLPSPNGRE